MKTCQRLVDAHEMLKVCSCMTYVKVCIRFWFWNQLHLNPILLFTFALLRLPWYKLHMTSWYKDNNKLAEGLNTYSESTDSMNRKIPASRRPNHRFDFEIGYLVKSPCRSCVRREEFPGCDETCDTLDEIHSILCDSVSCTKLRWVPGHN